MELNINKTNLLEFNLLIEGTNDPIKEARFTFLTNPMISFNGNVDNGKLSFKIENIKRRYNLL